MEEKEEREEKKKGRKEKRGRMIKEMRKKRLRKIREIEENEIGRGDSSASADTSGDTRKRGGSEKESATRYQIAD